jgi:hypothetical protein
MWGDYWFLDALDRVDRWVADPAAAAADPSAAVAEPRSAAYAAS